MPTLSLNVELSLYADGTALISTSRSSSLLVSCLKTYLGRLEHWLRDWRIGINVSNSTAVLFTKTARRIQTPRPVQFSRKPIQWVETWRYLWVTLETRLTCMPHVSELEGRQHTDWACLLPSLIACPSELVCFFISNSPVPWWMMLAPSGAPAVIYVSCKCCYQSVFALRLTRLETQQANSRVFGNYVFRLPHQSIN
jgi:hypothetical protein